MIIAVTRNDEINMLICQIAFSIFKIPKKIARIRSQDYLNPKFTRVYTIKKIYQLMSSFHLKLKLQNQFKENLRHQERWIVSHLLIIK